MADSAQTASVRVRLPAQPINRWILASLALVALLPLGLLAVKLYDTAWDNAWREIREKHQLLAQNLAAPLSIYVNDHRNALRLLATTLESMQGGRNSVDNARVLEQAADSLHGFRSITLVDRNGGILYSNDPEGRDPAKRMAFSKGMGFLQTRDTGNSEVSGIKVSPLTGKPTLIISQAVRGPDGQVREVLLGELKIDLIEKLRRNIRFGKKGHSAIVDQYGHVIAHPNPEWMASMKDLSAWPIVQAMMAGKTGATEFYSPFIKASMVAGYASVPDVGWGVMVPQPKSEVAEVVSHILWTEFTWGVFGLVLSMILAILLARWITRPLNQLAKSAEQLSAQGFHGELPPVPASAPLELHQLGQAFARLVDGLQKSRDQVDQLNQSLASQVEAATAELRQANQMLEQLSKEDHLTGLANRRCFESDLRQCAAQRSANDDGLCIILVDVDHFKQINDKYGHAAGDSVLVQLSGLLKAGTRTDDLVARYGGDEFMVKMHCSKEVGCQRAKQLIHNIEAHSFVWEGQELHITISVGLIGVAEDLLDKPDVLLQRIDRALYEAKGAGRNRLVEVAA